MTETLVILAVAVVLWAWWRTAPRCRLCGGHLVSNTRSALGSRDGKGFHRDCARSRYGEEQP